MSSLALLEQMLTKGKVFWWALFALGSGLFAAALYWQYVIGDDPCQVCIQARLWAVALGLLGAVMLPLPESLLTRLTGLVLAFISSAGMGERAYYLYEIENFRGDGSCEFTLGMPSWFAVDQWFPALFEVRKYMFIHAGNRFWHQHGRGADGHCLCCLPHYLAWTWPLAQTNRG